MCAMEDMAGGSLDGIFNRQFSAVRLILWGGMIDELPELTLNDVGAILDRHIATGASLDDIIELCHRALENSGFIEND